MDETGLLARASSMIGAEVHNPQGQNLGKIEDMVIDLDYGQVAYAVLSFGGFLGLGDKYFAIPWEALDLDDEVEGFILNVDPEVLKNSEGFDKENWPDFANYTWGQAVYEYYGYEPYWS